MVKATSYTFTGTLLNVAETWSVVPSQETCAAVPLMVLPGPTGTIATATGAARQMLPRLPSPTSVIVAASVTVPAVPPGAFTLTDSGLPAESATTASSRDTVSVPLPVLLTKFGLVVLKLAPIPYEPAPSRIW